MEIKVEQTTRLGDIDRHDWEQLDTSGNPFLHYDFLKGLEEYKCLDGHGWEPCHLKISSNTNLLGVLPLYFRNNSYGEFVFDWLWADAYERAGGRYYPKLVSAIPFTPVCGPRLLVKKDFEDKNAIRKIMLAAIEQLLQDTHMSSWHCLFTVKGDEQILQNNQMLLRKTIQYHWHNTGFKDFDSFLSSLTAKRRKQIKRERRSISDSDIQIETIPGNEITEEQWQIFYQFYCSTFHRRWGSPRLTLDFFLSLSDNLPEQTLLMLASHANHYIAGAFSMLDSDVVYGRHWGCSQHVDNLHFELCYYQTIDFCIRNGLKRVDAGVQGEHKINRGFTPVATISGHLIQHDGFRQAIDHFLTQENVEIDDYIEDLEEHLPYKQAVVL